MKRLLPALTVASMLGAAPAVADYRACMEFCTKEHAFGHCNDVCSGQAANRPGPSPSTRPGVPAPPVTRTQPPAAAPKAAKALPPIPDVLRGRDCSSTIGEGIDALSHYIWKTYEPTESLVFPLGDSEDWPSNRTFEVGFFQEDKQRYCRAWMEITDECRVSIIARPDSDLLLAQRPLFSEAGSYFVKVEHGELKCMPATE